MAIFLTGIQEIYLSVEEVNITRKLKSSFRVIKDLATRLILYLIYSLKIILNGVSINWGKYY